MKLSLAKAEVAAGACRNKVGISKREKSSVSLRDFKRELR